MSSIIAVFIGGGFGSLARYGISQWAQSSMKTSFPLGTLLSNVLACLAMGLILYFLKDKLTENDVLKPLVLIGFCGGFSTFSTFSYETVNLLKSGNHYYAIANVVISIVLCLAILFVLTKKEMV